MSGKRNDPEPGKTREISLEDFKMNRENPLHESMWLQPNLQCKPFAKNKSFYGHAHLQEFSKGTEEHLIKSNIVLIGFLADSPKKNPVFF